MTLAAGGVVPRSTPVQLPGGCVVPPGWPGPAGDADIHLVTDEAELVAVVRRALRHLP